MSGEDNSSISRATWSRLSQSVKNLAASEVGGKAKLMAVGLIIMSVTVNGLNVLASYVGRDFMTAIAGRHTNEFVLQAIIYVGVFTVLTLIVVLLSFYRGAVGTALARMAHRADRRIYLDHRIYYRLDEAGVSTNPDQRIADDVRTFTVTTSSFTVLLLNGTFTVLAFSGVLWTISPLLFGASVVYAVGGTWLAIILGKRLIPLNYYQLDKEANFRADLIHVRENAESVAMLHREGRMKIRLLGQLDALVDNFKHMIAADLNLSFFTTGYNYR